MISKTAARAQAHRESHMYRQGSGWIVSTWSDTRRLNILTHEMEYWRARQALADWRVERALVLQLEVIPQDGGYIARVASQPALSAWGETEREALAEAGVVCAMAARR